ncbi:MAG: DUF432 domain-containing protein [Desulfurococcaceae archaeon]
MLESVGLARSNMLFGKHYVADRLEFNLNQGRVVLERLSGELVRLSVSSKNGVMEKLLYASESTPIYTKPIPPFSGPLDVSCLYLVLNEPIVVPPFAKIEMVQELPVDLGVFLGEVIVATLPLGRVKYALYGVPDMGDVCRYADSQIRSSYVALAKALLRITSTSKNTVEVGKLVVPIQSSTVVYTDKGSLFFSDVSVDIVTPHHIEVHTLGMSSIIDGSPQLEFKGSGSTYIMKFGA